MSKNAVIVAAVIVVLVIGGWFLTRPKPAVAPEVSQPAPAVSESATVAQNSVTISQTGFSPATITIKIGESITWENTDTENHTVNSDNHPTHLLYSFLNLGLLKPEETKSVTFDKTGTYTYHDHLNPSLTGSITVE